MTEILTKIIVDCETGEQTIVPLTDEEIAERAAAEAIALEKYAAEQMELEQKIVAKQSAKTKLIDLGLSEEEITALIG